MKTILAVIHILTVLFVAVRKIWRLIRDIFRKK